MHELIQCAQRLSDRDLLDETLAGSRRERVATARLVAHLGEIDSRGLALREGFSSTFDYCRRALGFSEGEAAARLETARAARRFPLVLDLLQAGELTMTTAMILGRHLTEDNHERLLRGARGRTKEQLREMVAALMPKPDAPVLLRRAPEPAPPARVVATSRATPPMARPTVVPLAPERFRYQVTIGQKARDLLTTARQLTTRDDESLLERALELLVEDLSRVKFAATTAPRSPGERHPDSRHVPSAVRREVWARDGARCAFVSTTGRRCEARHRLEFHHVKPYEAGGDATVDNIQLRCRTHNQYESRAYFTRGA